jgi:hypothetical protein
MHYDIGNPRFDKTRLSYVGWMLIEEMTTFDLCPIAPSTRKHILNYKNVIKASAGRSVDMVMMILNYKSYYVMRLSLHITYCKLKLEVAERSQ